MIDHFLHLADGNWINALVLFVLTAMGALLVIVKFYMWVHMPKGYKWSDLPHASSPVYESYEHFEEYMESLKTLPPKGKYAKAVAHETDAAASKE